MLAVAGYIACVLIGLTLGIFGAGGSILLVPVFVYLFGFPPVVAASYSLFVIGATSLIAAITKFHRGQVLWRPALLFGFISMTVVLIIRHTVVPYLPVNLFRFGAVMISYNLASMLVFSLLMIASSFMMFYHFRLKNPVAIIPYALLIGLVTGLLGAGGGFLIVPVMTMALGMTIKKAIGTSLAVIALNSLSGFAVDVIHHSIDWKLLLVISFITINSALAGAALERNQNSARLKNGFSWLVCLLGLSIFSLECYHIIAQL